MVTHVENIDSSFEEMVVRRERPQGAKNVNGVRVVCIDDKATYLLGSSSTMSIK